MFQLLNILPSTLLIKLKYKDETSYQVLYDLVWSRMISYTHWSLIFCIWGGADKRLWSPSPFHQPWTCHGKLFHPWPTRFWGVHRCSVHRFLMVSFSVKLWHGHMAIVGTQNPDCHVLRTLRKTLWRLKVMQKMEKELQKASRRETKLD